MHDKPTDKPVNIGAPPGAHPLKLMSAEQFAALGLETVVFARQVDGDALARLVPEAQVEDMGEHFILVMSADGRPILVTDSEDSLQSWLEEQPVVLVTVH